MPLCRNEICGEETLSFVRSNVITPSSFVSVKLSCGLYEGFGVNVGMGNGVYICGTSNAIGHAEEDETLRLNRDPDIALLYVENASSKEKRGSEGSDGSH